MSKRVQQQVPPRAALRVAYSKTRPEKIAAQVQTVSRWLWPQWLRTVLVVIAWLGTVPVYVALVATYDVYSSAYTAAVGLAIFSGLAPHLWRSRTSPWRTVVWAYLLSVSVGAMMLTAGADRFSLMAATIVGFTFVALRADQNGRKLWRLFQTWRTMR